MVNQKRFQKQKLDSEKDRLVENASKILKTGAGIVATVVVLICNKDNMKALGKGAANIARNMLK